MKKILFVIATVIGLALPLSAQEVNGDTLTLGGKKILWVWGSHYERGYAHGYYLGEQVKEMMDDYVIGYIFSNNAMLYTIAYNYYLASFNVEPKYFNEVQGIFDGAAAAGISMYNSTLGRDFTVDDGMMVNALGDLSGVFADMQGNYECSTLTSWGIATQNDPELAGNLVVMRNFDWDMHTTLLNNHLLTVNLPSETDESPWINLGFPGLIAPFSAVSADGIAAFQNVGNYGGVTVLEQFHPISLSVRNGIEMADYNADQVHSRQDVADAVGAEISVSSWIITTADPEAGFIVEINNSAGSVVRTEADNTVIPENQIAATNHHRLLYPPDNCYRYDNISDSLRANEEISVARSWGVICGAAGVPWNVHCVQFVPATGLLKFAAAPNTFTPAYTQDPSEFYLDELLIPPSSAGKRESTPASFNLSAFPNPFNSQAVISFAIDRPGNAVLTVFNIQGREVSRLYQGYKTPGSYDFIFNASAISSGVYFAALNNGSKSQVMKLILLK